MGRRPDFTVIVATFGDESWQRRAEMAAETASEADEVILCHHKALHLARNKGAERARGEWLVFLDADDELTPGYFDAMSESLGDLRSPAVQYVRDGIEEPPVLLQPKPIQQGNWMVIGTAVRRNLFNRAGGFHAWELYEDWDLWWRCMRLGALNTQVPRAVYRAHMSAGSRNEPSLRTKRAMLAAIRGANGE